MASAADLGGYNATSLKAAERAFRNSPHAYHPETMRWIRVDFQKIVEERGKEPEHGEEEEYGMVRILQPKGATMRLSEDDLQTIYMKHMAGNGIRSQESPKEIHRRLTAMAAETLRKWASSKRNSQFEKTVGTKEAAEKLILNVSREMKVDSPRVGWIETLPVRMAVYAPSHRSLLLHEFCTRMRAADIITLALHEIVGHMHQETRNSLPVGVNEAEFCAMLCENLSSRFMGTMRYTYEWKMFRIARALVDLRLHALPRSAKSPRHIWETIDAQIDGGLSHFVPFFDETIRCAALPAQALTYVLEMSRNPRGCHRECVNSKDEIMN